MVMVTMFIEILLRYTGK